MAEGARKDVTKKVRMSQEEAARLAAVARKTGRSESETLRDAIRVLEEYESQRDALQGLIDMIDPDEEYVKEEIWLR